MSKNRDIEMLEHKIIDLNVKIANFEKQLISQKKINSLKILKLQYEDELLELEYS